MMTKLIVTPLDLKAPGSHRARDRMLGAFEAMEEAQAGNSAKAIRAAYRVIEETLKPHMRTDDGTPVDEALDQVSGDEFLTLWQHILGPVDTVGEGSASS